MAASGGSHFFAQTAPGQKTPAPITPAGLRLRKAKTAMGFLLVRLRSAPESLYQPRQRAELQSRRNLRLRLSEPPDLGLLRNGNTETWTLDSLGNWLDWTVNGVSQTRSTDPSNEIGSITQGGSTSSQGYDLAGNMTLIADPNSSQGTLFCTYDAWDRLVEVQAGSSSGVIIAEFSYDGTNRRVSQTDFTPSSGPVATYYFYSGQQVVETREGAVVDSQIPDPQSLVPSSQYVWSLRYINAPILRDSFDSSGNVEPSSRIYYLGDANYNVTALVNSSGTVIERYSYDPYGKVTVYEATWTNPGSTSSVGNTILFAGGSVDTETGLVLFGLRYYSVTLGAFISQDPTGYAGGTNVYAYCDDCPPAFTDPEGEARRRWTPITIYELNVTETSQHAGVWGGFSVGINWQVTPAPLARPKWAHLPATSWIVQRVNVTFNTTNAAGVPIPTRGTMGTGAT